jgi:hypothetical protein
LIDAPFAGIFIAVSFLPDYSPVWYQLPEEQIMTSTLRIPMVAMVVLLTHAAWGQSLDKPKSSDPPKEYRWEDAAREHKLSDREIALLRQHKFVIASEPWKQIFQPYVSSKAPVFITSDSLLNGFHVLFEESIYRLEMAHARKLPALLATLSKSLDGASKQFKGDAELLQVARKRVDIFLATARCLLDAKVLPEDTALRKLVQEEVERVTAAKGASKPAWLGPPEEGFLALDYSRFKPRGFYTKSGTLERYFRAVSWLQAVPWRLDNDTELCAFLLMSRAFHGPKEKDEGMPSGFWHAFRRLLGVGDDWDLPSAYFFPDTMTREGLKKVREDYRGRATQNGGPEINDQIRFAPATADGKLELAFRFLSAARLPDGVLFQRTMKRELAEREFPTGLEVCAALGSPFARDRLGKDVPKVLQEIERSRALFPKPTRRQDVSLYTEYLQCLGTLLERTEPDAPAFLHSDAWKSKTCQTALAGWAQLRHTFALQAKPGAHWMCASHCSAGFIEPVPEFYGRLGKLVEAAREILDEAGALAPSDGKEIVNDLEAAAALVEKARKEKNGLASLTPEELMLLGRFEPRLDDWLKKPDKDQTPEKILAAVSSMLGAYQGVMRGGMSPIEIKMMLGFDTEIAPQWKELLALCRRLEVLSHKQLRQIPFSEEEEDFLHNYGKTLGHIMLYGGNSYHTPRDDAPRVVDVYSNPTLGKHLHVGTDKPRLIWVLYPVKGVDILCRGAVLPYHEFAHGARLTDSAWQTLLASPERPETPAWIQPVMAEVKGKKTE